MITHHKFDVFAWEDPCGYHLTQEKCVCEKPPADNVEEVHYRRTDSINEPDLHYNTFGPQPTHGWFYLFSSAVL